MDLSILAGWVGSAFVGNIVDKMFRLLGNRNNHQTDDSKVLLNKLQNNMKNVNFAMDRAGHSQIKNPSSRAMMDDIKDAFDEADDILNLFTYRDLQAKHEVCNSTSIISSEDINELRRIGERFSEIVENLPIYLESLKLEENPNETKDWRQTTSIINEPNFFGRIHEKTRLKLLLKYINEEDSLNYRVIALVGIGGIGKTALAQSVYNDQEVINHFDIMEWIYVSEKFDVHKLTVKILQLISGEKYKGLKNRELEYLQKLMRRELYNKKFLIILDDIWNEIRGNWEILSKPFKYAKPGSKIVITTRNKNVSTLMDTKEVIELNGLDDKNYWSLFCQCAFGDQNPINYPKLHNLGKQIVTKLSGSPLAAKTIGGALKSQLEEDQWREILKCRLWQVEQKPDDIFPALKLSLKHLPKHLQQCFIYCAVFPKYYLFKKETLIRIWIAHDFIQPGHSSRKTLEDVGADYFNELLNWSFFESATGATDYYVIPNLLHDIVESVSNDEYFRIGEHFHAKIPTRVRHIYANTKNLLILHDKSIDLTKIRSLIIHHEPGAPFLNSCDVLQEVLKRAIGLRVLILPNIPGILTKPINHLVHLCYLDVRYKTIPDLKNSINKLFHLQFLILDVEQKTQIPLLTWMNRLTNLRYINAPREIMRNIPYIGKLIYLQELKEYKLREEKGFDLGQFKEMDNLEGPLCIKNLEKARGIEESKMAELEKKDKIKLLSLNWSTKMGIETKIIEEHENVLEGLCPNPNLQNLEIIGYLGTKSASWLEYASLRNLEQIKLRNCKNWEIIPPFGELPYLKILHLISINMKQIGVSFFGFEKKSFPYLEELLLEELKELKEWSLVERDQELFPSLKKLTIIECDKLKGPLPLPPMKNKIQIRVLVSSSSISPSNSSDPTPKFELIIDRISLLHKCIPAVNLHLVQTLDISSSCLKNFTSEQERWFEQLKSLEKLAFQFCPDLIGLPSALPNITSLQSLHLEKCLNLKVLPEGGLPPNLKELEIKTCKKLGRHCRPGSGNYGPQVSHITTIVIDGKDIRE